MLNSVPLQSAESATISQDAITSRDWLEVLALNIAQSLELINRPRKSNPLPTRLKTLGSFLQSAYRASQSETFESHAAEWMLDNFYIIEQALRQISENLPANYYQRLPKVKVNGGVMARIYTLAFVLTRANNSHLDVDRIRNFVRAFQTITALSIGEIWALTPMLKLSVLETLAESLTHITHLDLSPVSFLDAWPAEPSEQPDHSLIDHETIVINSILSLRMFSTQDWQAFFESTNVVENILREDPAHIYARMDFETRNRYRNVIEELANDQNDETNVAREAIRLACDGQNFRAQHVGYYLIGSGRPALESRLGYRPPRENRIQHWLYHNPTSIYLLSITSLTALLCIIATGFAIYVDGNILQVILTAALSILPASAITVDLLNWLIIQIVPPRILPRLNLQDGIPAEFSTMVVIPSLLKNQAELESLLHQLESHFLGNSDPNVRFALLSDFIDASQKELSGESELVEQAKAGVERLNVQYGNEGYSPFYLFHRDRIWNPAEGCWMGWERKRGKLAEFNNLLRGKHMEAFQVQIGDLSILNKVRYVLTLDTDTNLPRDGVQRMVGILAHPLNQAEFDPQTGAVIDGYTVLQPRVQVRPTAANRSIFTRIYSGDMTLDLYTRAVSDVYQDLFGEGSYVGKGLYDVAAFERSLEGRVPDNMLLSHDLFEGIHGRCGLVTNVVLFEDYPLHYLVHAKRLHRWIRGDWQLLPWLMPHIPHRVNGQIPNDLSTLSRWKIFDNLRRSLVGPAVITLMVSGWFLLPGFSFIWIALGLSAFILSIVFGAFATLRARRTDQYPETTARPVQQAGLRALLQVIFLPYESLIALDAIITTLVRLMITRKRLLQWVTAAHTVNVFGRELKVRVAWHEMITASLFSFLLLLLVIFLNPSVLWLASPFLIGWALSPFIAVSISRPISYITERLKSEHEKRLHLLARTTWLYFEHFVGPDDHWLPPDHFQEEPRGIVAHRTSPTNIGLLLLSTLSAWDFGYIGPQEFLLRVRNTLDGMDRLEKQRGHFLNWYDTRTLNPLPPRYISTVDSGNLAASLLTLRQGCRDVVNKPVVHWEGLVDTLNVLDATLHQSHLTDAAELHEVVSHLGQQVEGLRKARQCNPQFLASLFRESRVEMEDLLVKVVEVSAEQLDSDTIRHLSTWIERTRHHLTQTKRDIENLCPWSLTMARVPVLFVQPDLRTDLGTAWNEFLSAFSFRPTLKEVPAICACALDMLQRVHSLLHEDEQDASIWCESFACQLENAHSNANELLDGISAISKRAEAYIQAMNFGFLFDAQRKVFHVGYNVDSERLDSSYYDLLVSEARLTSLIAIAKGNIPQNHWLYLARPITQLNGVRALLSWSGTMFEYLMPILLTRRYPGTLLDQSCRAAIEQQINYGQARHVPWGISESSFYYFDANQVYQYRAFGIPGLGYKRGLAEDLVISPYASILALPFVPLEVIQNLEHLQKLDMLGLYGLYEAIDFTTDRLGTGQNYAVVHSYMAHHQGMILISLCNYLCEETMVQRFHNDPRIDTVRLLLQEQNPVRAPIEYPHPQEIGTYHPVHSSIALNAWRVKPDVPYPQVHFLSNGNYSLLITAAGSGYSHWQGVDLTRWSADPTLDNLGSWIYIKDQRTDRLWSAGFQPTMTQPVSREVRFYPHTVEFLRRDGEISTHMNIVIAPDADVEIRRITLTNHAESSRRLKLTSYAEVILAPQPADRRHPAYNKLFIESEYIADENILLFRRRPRSATDKPVYLAHFVVDEHDDIQITGYGTDRGHFLGRGNTTRSPAALQTGSLLSDSTTSLDPISALQAQITVPAFESYQMAFVTLAASSRKDALNLVRRYKQWHPVSRAFDEARVQVEHELAQIGFSSPQIEQIQKLLSILLYPSSSLRSDSTTLAANTLGQSGLWPFSISGDYPILLVYVKREKDLDLLNEVLQAHTYWRRRGLMIDLAIMNRRETSYDHDFQGKIYRLLSRTNNDEWLGKRGGIFVLHEDQMSEAERILIATAARAILDGEAGSLAEQLEKLDRAPIRLPRLVPLLSPSSDSAQPLKCEQPADLLFDNGLGGFSSEGHEYVIHLDRDQWTPAPWVNVIANPEFGFLVSESGMGCTWAINSGENRLTPWHNDPVSDPPSEAIYLRDEDTGHIWSPTPLPARADASYLIRHGMGYTIFENQSHKLEQTMKVFAAPDAPVKIVQLKLKNTTSRLRRINISYYAEWVLGTTHADMAPYIVSEFESNCFALLARNPYNRDFGQRVAFLAATRELQGLTTDRAEFIGSLGSYAHPDALERVGLTANIQAGTDPCAAIQLLLWLAPDETKEVTFLLGQGKDREDAMKLITHYQNLSNVQAAWEAVGRFWDEQLGGIQIKTPDKSIDLLVNRWLPYQALTSRLWGRTAFYQSSGAYGYRDQLQDVLAFLYTKPSIAREHILNAARHQFEQGDVLHWWHPPVDRGIRTRITDNLLWLPYVTARYVNVTGDLSILDQKIPFLSAEYLKDGEHERYGEFSIGSTDTLYEHCRRALVKGMTTGPHGLPLIGEGDWNDGMNNIGVDGKGESVWLGWFLYSTLMDFARVCDLIPSADDAQACRQQAEELRVALEDHAWDGSWYRRAYYDDGAPLGSMENHECQIDSISQSWAVISCAAKPERARTAMDSLYKHLVRQSDNLILLLTPPFDRTMRDPGYIKGYLPGIRENGGQYTHAALWAIWAFAELGDGDRVAELLRLINPIYHADTPQKIECYRVEPYVVAADVYSASSHVGRGGWTWYTGSASWMYRLVIEKILGLQRHGDHLKIEPCISKEWREYEIHYRFGSIAYHIHVENPHGVNKGVSALYLDDKRIDDQIVHLVDDGREHNVRAIIG